ncbi:MAG: hypothetical protein R3195_19170 [Gemmatimonadota bacterium]|nr:hypothetical protein [Gemmatimonadota bacterium]
MLHDDHRTSLRVARRRLIEALRAGEYRHEAREALAEKNMLAVGRVTPEEVVRLLRRCRGEQHGTSPHHADRELVVHEFKPYASGRKWYVKAYFRGSTAWFISVHPGEE